MIRHVIASSARSGIYEIAHSDTVDRHGCARARAISLRTRTRRPHPKDASPPDLSGGKDRTHERDSATNCQSAQWDGTSGLDLTYTTDGRGYLHCELPNGSPLAHRRVVVGDRKGRQPHDVARGEPA